MRGEGRWEGDWGSKVGGWAGGDPHSPSLPGAVLLTHQEPSPPAPCHLPRSRVGVPGQ